MKEIQKEQNERFWRINEICKLIAKTPLSTSQIAEKLGVSERTIQRDLNGVLAKYGAVRNGRLWSIDESKIDPKDENQIILAVLDKMAKNVGSELIEILESVIASHNEIELLYFSKTHRLSPIKIALFDGFWYLLAMAGQKLKKFHLKSIKEIKILPSKFKIDANLENRIKSANSVWFDINEKFYITT